VSFSGVSRRSFYRSLKARQPAEEEMEVRSAIQQIALEHRRRYGYRRIAAELHRRGMQVNHKRVVRIMREDSLLGIQPKPFVATTNSSHKFEVYLNLAARMKLTAVNQLWVADITYIRLKAEFVYLAVILDAFSRRVVGWTLDRTLAARLTIRALEQALEGRQPEAGLVHHSDRGFQYACAEYITIIEKYRMVASMSRPANPYDNASCESFMKTLKREEIYANKYEDLEHLRANIAEFIEEYYNRQRLHSALGYRSPAEFEQQAEGRTESRSGSRPDVNQFLMQYFINYNMQKGWFIGLAPIITANWEARRGNVWTVPFGGGIGRITKFGAQPVSLLAQFYGNAVHPANTPAWTMRLQISFLFPKLTKKQQEMLMEKKLKQLEQEPQ
jgi:putative transposase